MQNFIDNPIIIKSHALFDVAQCGNQMEIIAKSPRVRGGIEMPIEIAEIESNPKHYLRNLLPGLKKAGAVAMVHAEVDGKAAQISINAAEYAAGQVERQRYADWSADIVRQKASLQARERHFDGQNEGGEGYNPYRNGSAPSYRRGA